MKGIEELKFALKAGNCYFYCETWEQDKTVRMLVETVNAWDNNGAKLFIPIKIDGTGRPDIWDYEFMNEKGESQMRDPDECLTMLENVQDGMDEVEKGTVVIAKNWNWFLKDDYGNPDKTKTTWLVNRAVKFSSKDFRKVFIIVGSEPFDKAIPEMLRRDFVSIEFPLPDAEEIEKLYEFTINSVKSNPKFSMPTKKQKRRIISAARGLTANEIIKVFSFTIIKNEGIFDPKTVEMMKAEEINSTPGLTILNPSESMEDLIGFEVALEIVDDWIDDDTALGIILLGPAGVGKTHFCRAVANKYGRMIIEWEFAQMMGEGLVGQAENAQRRAIQVIYANANPEAPIVVLVDELEKGLAGTSGAGGGGGTRDGGTTDRSNSQFLKMLSDPPKGVYFVCTCNDIERLPAAYIRMGRFDTAPLFVDLPSKPQQKAILDHYRKQFSLKEKPKCKMADWSGAEIKAWCKLAAKKIKKGKPANDADMLIVPVARTMEREISYLRKWKDGRTVPASRIADVKMAKGTEDRGISI